MRDIFRFIFAAFVVWPESFWGDLNTSVYPPVHGRVLHSEGFLIMIQIIVLGRYCAENRIFHIF